MTEYWDLLDQNRNPLGTLHRRGDPLPAGARHLCVEVITLCRGRMLTTRRHPQKHNGGFWEVTTGSALAGETSRAAAVRELYEETGIRAAEGDFRLLDTDRDKSTIYHFYCLKRYVPLREVVLLPGETDDAMWASFGKIHWMIRRGMICKIIAGQFLRQEPLLKLRNMPKKRN